MFQPILNCSDLNEYLSKLSEDTKQIQINSNIFHLPDLSRFRELEELHISGNKIAVLPEKFSEIFPKLKKLYCGGNLLTELPMMGDNMEELYCANNLLTSLPPLSNLKKLKNLFCSINQIVELPILPANLKILLCNNNRLTRLPELPSTLTKLCCGSNQLSVLPKLPNALKELSCYNNQIMWLPCLPEDLTDLRCDNNRLTSLPMLGTHITQLDFDNNPIHEITNFDQHDEVYDDDDENNGKIALIRDAINKINKFREFYYINKFKTKFLDILWIKIREPKIREKYSPSRIIELLYEIGEDDDNFDKFDSLLENM